MWKVIQNEPMYEVSDRGEVRSKVTKRLKSLRISKRGYLRVTLYPSGKTYTVHRLVAENHLKGDFKIGLTVNHINGNKLDNSVENLEWITQGENNRHSIRTGLKTRDVFVGTRNGMSKFTTEEISKMNELKLKGKTTAEIAGIIGSPYERTRRFLKKETYC